MASEPKEKALALAACAGVALLLPKSVRCCRNIAQLSKVFAGRQGQLIEIPLDTGKEASVGDINFARGVELIFRSFRGAWFMSPRLLQTTSLGLPDI